jgi:hypothetical protein
MLQETELESIDAFLREWQQQTNWNAMHSYVQGGIPRYSQQELRSSRLGLMLQQFARIAAGEVEWDQLEAGEYLKECEDLVEWMFDYPGRRGRIRIPFEFWSIPIGQLLLQVMLWCRQDALSPEQAEEIEALTYEDMIGLLGGYKFEVVHIRETTGYATRLVCSQV